MKQKYFFSFFMLFYFVLTIGQNNAMQITNDDYFSCNRRFYNTYYDLDSSNFTIEYDFYLNSLTTYNGRFTAFQYNSSSTVAKPIHFYINDLGESNLLLGNGSTEESVPGMPSFNEQQWYHIAMVVTNTATKNVKLYVNGVATVDYDFTATLDGFDTQTFLHLGATNFTSASNTGNAKFDNLRIWSTARTATEILDNYASCLSGNETGLVGYFNFDGFNGRFVKNLAINSNPINVSVSSTYISYVPGSGCTVTPLYAPITVTGTYPGIYYYVGQYNGKPYYKTDNLEINCSDSNTQAKCQSNPHISKIIWENNQWELQREHCVWELGESCVTYFNVISYNTDEPAAINTADTAFPPCSGWSFTNSGENGTFSSDDCAALSISNLEFEKNILVYPNPTKDYLNIDAKETISIELINLLGEVISTKSNFDGFHKIDVSYLNSGIYFLKATNQSGKNKSFKIIKD